MDCHHCITESAERKKGQHLRMEDRGAIKVLKKQVLSPRAIARQIGCAPSTVTNELRRGTPATRATRGKLQVTPHAGRSRL
ncbi:MAG: helix-turn-helix domain-containing protein [Gallintestinimicrobium sp.]